MQNALALLRIFGSSDLFITFTANPNWIEIKDAIFPGQSPCDRLDIVACVFFLKCKSLLKDIMEKSIFGAAVTYVYTIEYQKWGLPHMHLIVFMDPLAHLSMPSCVDSHISAEFPDEDAELILFDLVKTFMVHGPCIHDQCLNDKNCCMKGFPKPFQPETEFSSQSYVKLR